MESQHAVRALAAVFFGAAVCGAQAPAENSYVSVYSLATPKPGGGKVPAPLPAPDANQEAEDEAPVAEGLADPQLLASTRMRDHWAWEAYAHSPQGSTCLIPTEEGFVVHDGTHAFVYELDWGENRARLFRWDAAGKRLAFWAPVGPDQPQGRIAVLELKDLEPRKAPRFRVLYTPDLGSSPRVFRWGPGDTELFVVERVSTAEGEVDRILRIPLDGSATSELFRVSPGSAIENYSLDASGRAQAPAVDLVFTRAGRGPVRGSRVGPGPALPTVVGGALYGLAENPVEPGSYAFSVWGTWGVPEGREGVFLLREGSEGAQEAFKLYGEDAAQLEFSARGTYVVWATQPGRSWMDDSTESRIHVARTARPTDTISIQQAVRPHVSRDGLGVLVFHGTPGALEFSMNADETRLAYTAGNRVFVYELASGKRTQVAHFPEREWRDTPNYMLPNHTIVRKPAFTSAPRWVGERVVVTLYEDLTGKREFGRRQFKR